ncbi:CBL-interacting protein kinase 33 [Diplonema papillatum]|nr:CBL-interacting protein kinase 33 [Diplonema papillatum]|eukprot:gene18116-27901_t
MKVGQYELGKTIGRGAFSKVKVATHMESGEEFVVKIIDKLGDGKKSPQDVKQEVKGEISIMKRLRHENIVRMYEVMESSKHYYIVLESVRGGDLCDHIMTEGKLDEKTAKRYLRNLCEGLLACHRAGVAHRDIKPENCLISRAGALKVADFGLSRFHRSGSEGLAEEEYATDSVGTLSYAAPEVLDGPYNAFLADLWSVGVVVFVMLTGKFPFGSKGYTDAQIQEDIRAGKINRFPSSLSTESKALITELIVVDPLKRLDLDGVLRHQWMPVEDAKKARPGAIDIEQVRDEAKRDMQANSVIASTMSPTWADSPASGNRQKFTPQLFSPKANDGVTSPTLPPLSQNTSHTSHALPPAISQNHHLPPNAGLNMADLKSMLHKEGKELKNSRK